MPKPSAREVYQHTISLIRKDQMPRTKSTTTTEPNTTDTENEQPRAVRTRTVRTRTARATATTDSPSAAIAMPPTTGMTAEQLSEEVRAIQESGYRETQKTYREPQNTMPLDEPDDLYPDELDDQDDTTGYRPGNVRRDREMIQHPKPKYTYAMLSARTLADLRKLAKDFEVNIPANMRKDDVIISILKAQAESMNYRFGGGTLEILPENFGFLRPKGMLPTDNDVYLSSSQIRRFGLRNGDVIWGLIRPPRDQEHYEALLRVETVNFTDPEHSRNRPVFSQLTPIFPNVRLSLEYDPKDIATRLVDMFAPIGLGQRALIVSPPKAGKTTLLKRIARAIAASSPDIIIMALLIDERPEEVTDISRSIDGEVIASTFDRPSDEHIRVANLALEKAKRLVEAKRDVVILLDSITRLARASNLTVPPSGRTLSGGLDPSGLYFPKRFFGAARNFEEGGSLTIIGTALTDTGSRMDDVIYEEFKGTGNMELHLSRKLAEQRIFPAIDITKSGTRREELLMPEDDLKRLWILRKRIAGVDEAGALNLILDKLKQTENNEEFLSSIKLA